MSLMRCEICGSEKECYYNDTCDEHGHNRFFWLCAKHQAEYYAATERFLEAAE